MKQIRQFFIFTCLIFLCNGCASTPVKGATPENKKVYLGVVPIEHTQAYKAFLRGSGSETAKLYYLLDRIKETPNLTYLFEGVRYPWFDAYAAGTWILWHHHKKGEEAHGFLHKELSAYPTAGSSAIIELSDRSHHLAYPILINELDLLEETVKQGKMLQYRRRD